MPIFAFEGHVPRIHPGAFVAPTAVVIGDVEIGEGSSIWYGAVLRGDLDPIRVGARTSIQDNAVLHTGLHEPCIIGDDVTVGHSAIVHGCTIRSGCLVGMGSCVLNRTVVGEQCIIGAMALVPEGKIYEPRRMILGVPAKVIREVTDKDLEGVQIFTQRYVENGARHARALAEFQAATGIRL